jgi:hypothetical protein
MINGYEVVLVHLLRMVSQMLDLMANQGTNQREEIQKSKWRIFHSSSIYFIFFLKVSKYFFEIQATGSSN